MLIKKNIPNFITLLNLLCGVVATYYAVGGNAPMSALMIAMGIFFDFFDGMAARLLKVSSPMGKELDSLADMVTSGVAPGFIVYTVIKSGPCSSFAVVGLLIPLFAAWRLAKFNTDERQTHSFRGLPAPANALVWAAIGTSIGLSAKVSEMSLCSRTVEAISLACSTMAGSIVIIALLLLLNVAMVSDIPMFSLKFKNLSWKDNKLQFLFLACCALMLALFGILGIAFCIVLYIIFSLTFYQPDAD